MYHTAHVFGPDGSLLGTQDQTHLLSPVLGELSAGDHLTPIETEVGSLGLLLGNDVLFPETGRILAYQGAEVLIGLNAAVGNLAAAKFQHAFQARVAENEVYGAQSYLVGRNLWADKSQSEAFVGRSLIAGPMELVPRPNGVMAEMGESVQGVIAGVLDITGPASLVGRWCDVATAGHAPRYRSEPVGQILSGRPDHLCGANGAAAHSGISSAGPSHATMGRLCRARTAGSTHQ